MLLKFPEPVPDDGEIELWSDDDSPHADVPKIEIERVADVPRCIVLGPVSEAVAAVCSVTTATASLPVPQTFVARAEYTVLMIGLMVVLPEEGNAEPRPSMATFAAGSDDCQLSVSVSPGQALVFEMLSDNDGMRQTGAVGPGDVARLFEGRCGGGAGGTSGLRLICVTG